MCIASLEAFLFSFGLYFGGEWEIPPGFKLTIMHINKIYQGNYFQLDLRVKIRFLLSRNDCENLAVTSL